jgi:hypothetical protein
MTNQKNKNAPEQVSEEQPSVTSADKETSLEITIHDLNAMKNVIEMCSQRGAFKPAEMVAVGTLYSKLDQFIKAVTAAANN